MKIKFTEDFDYDSLLLHVKHVEEYKDDPRCKQAAKILINAIKTFGIYYNDIANNLTDAHASLSNDYTADVVGFINKDNNVCKYDRVNNDYIVYNPRSPRKKTHTLHKKTEDQFQRILQRDFKEELPENIK